MPRTDLPPRMLRGSGTAGGRARGLHGKIELCGHPLKIRGPQESLRPMEARCSQKFLVLHGALSIAPSGGEHRAIRETRREVGLEM